MSEDTKPYVEPPELTDDKAVLAYINNTPTLLSLLYDLDLLPEQHPDRESKEAWQILIIVNHWREHELSLSRELTQARGELEASRKRSQTRRCLVCGGWVEDVPGPTDPRWHVCVKHRGITKAETPFQYIAELLHDLEAARGERDGAYEVAAQIVETTLIPLGDQYGGYMTTTDGADVLAKAIRALKQPQAGEE